MTIIELINVSKNYKKKVIHNLSIKIAEGDFVGIIGKSGSGKSTLLNIIGLLENADSGDVIIDGNKNVRANSIKSNEIIRLKISYLFQNFALIDNATVYDNLDIALRYVKIKRSEKSFRINEALNIVGLDNYANKKVYELSGGEQQRVAIARVILKPSKIILADEPTGSLDIENRNKIMELLKELNKYGKTIILVTHDKEVANSCNRIIQL